MIKFKNITHLLLLIYIIALTSCGQSNVTSSTDFDIESFVNAEASTIKQVLCEKWGADTAYMEYIGTLPDSTYQNFRAKYDKLYPEGTYLQNGSDFEKISMDEYFEDYPPDAKLFRIFVTRKDRFQGNKFRDAGFRKK
jgi:hypothetical protein